MQSSLMHNKRKWTVAPNPIYLFALSGIVFLSLLVLDDMLYSGVISMWFFLVMFVSLSTWNLFAGLGRNESLRHNWINVWISALVLSIQILIFFLYLPDYTSTKAANIVKLSMGNVKVIETHTIDTLEPLGPFVKKGYVFSCTESTTNRHFIVFFNPISGAHYEMN